MAQIFSPLGLNIFDAGELGIFHVHLSVPHRCPARPVRVVVLDKGSRLRTIIWSIKQNLSKEAIWRRYLIPEMLPNVRPTKDWLIQETSVHPSA
jgi:hypothetical protein